MTEAIVHISIPGINHVFFGVFNYIYIYILKEFSDTLDIVNQESYSNAKQNELCTLTNEKLLSEVLDNDLIPDISVSTSSKLNETEIPSKLIPETEIIILFQL